MTISAEQRQARKSWIGASEVAALFGLSPYMSAYDVWAIKTGRVEGFQESGRMRVGTAFEPGILDLAERHLGTLVRDVPTIHMPELHLGANLDARIPDSSPVEAKLVSPHMADGWGEPRTDQIPDAYLLQAQTQLICTAQDLCYIAAYVEGEDDVRLYKVPRNECLAKRIMEFVPEWWERHVVRDTPPEGSLPSETIIRQIRRVPNKVAAVSADLLRVWRAAVADRTEADKAEADAKAALLAQLGDAEAGDGGEAGSITFFEQTSRRIDVNAMRKGAPDVAARYTKECVSRVLRDKGIRKAE